jgi:hypothetical protein
MRSLGPRNCESASGNSGSKSSAAGTSYEERSRSPCNANYDPPSGFWGILRCQCGTSGYLAAILPGLRIP